MSGLRVWLVGFGTVGRWVAGALRAQAAQLASMYGADVTVVGIGNARDGFVYHPDGLDLGSVLAAASGGRPITGQPGARAWPTAIDGLRATEADLLVEVTGSPPVTGEPGLAHMREALRRGIPVVTSNKWPVALHGLELAERDPAADVEGHDTVAKLMILSALVFGRQLRRDQVACEGITDITGRQARDAAAAGGRLRHVATLAFTEPGGAGTVTARVRPEALPADDPLARVDGPANALLFQASPVGQIMIADPGAGPQLAGQGVLADIIAVARRLGVVSGPGATWL